MGTPSSAYTGTMRTISQEWEIVRISSASLHHLPNAEQPQNDYHFPGKETLRENSESEGPDHAFLASETALKTFLTPTSPPPFSYSHHAA